MKFKYKCKYCRKFGQKIGLNERCLSGKCALVRRRTRPGMHGRKPKILSLFGKQLLEKQKLKTAFLLNEKQMKNYVKLAKSNKSKNSAEALIELLERRLDNVIWRAGFVLSKLEARQLVVHGHFLVNGRKNNIPSYLVKSGDVISVRAQSRNIKNFANIQQRLKLYNMPKWLSFDENNLSITVISLPQSFELQHNFDLSTVIDFYSRQ